MLGDIVGEVVEGGVLGENNIGEGRVGLPLLFLSWSLPMSGAGD
jgi:hypothetical protein